MAIDAGLARIRLQIKHGRTEGVEEKLKELLCISQCEEDDIRIYEVYALEYMTPYSDPRAAIPVLEKLLALTLPEETRIAAESELAKHQKRYEMPWSDVDLGRPDLLDFMHVLRDGLVFEFNANAEDIGEFHVIAELSQAQRTAWFQKIEPPFASWNSLRARAAGQLYGYCSENKINTPSLAPVYAEISAACDKFLHGEIMEFYDDIYGDLCMIAMGKGLGIRNPLHEEMWNAYQRGAYPSGWKGSYPDGKLCVYVPRRSKS